MEIDISNQVQQKNSRCENCESTQCSAVPSDSMLSFGDSCWSGSTVMYEDNVLGR